MPFRRGDTVIVQERWHGRLWSAVPHRWVSGGDRYVTYLPRGTRSALATNKGLPIAAGLSRSQRKLTALRTGVHTVVEHPADISTLHFFTPGSWARVDLGWTRDGTFTGWYVNFERPPTVLADGIVTKDLLLDLVISPGRKWSWKDRDEFDQAIDLGIVAAELRTVLVTEADRVVAWSGARTGPFDPIWRDWRPDPTWPTPVLPDCYRPGGELWGGLE